ncbi:hypothetical protein HU200_005314 [Digitaria exilis]|uniref:Homeobox domain-containing protein n=1 Tax=Digitaria exilis TaxID=1010633 RepID=A0A835FSB5_9POAL|nr:hypothetical protein HU200_005314 [Digitaria exilis]
MIGLLAAAPPRDFVDPSPFSRARPHAFTPFQTHLPIRPSERSALPLPLPIAHPAATGGGADGRRQRLWCGSAREAVQRVDGDSATTCAGAAAAAVQPAQAPAPAQETETETETDEESDEGSDSEEDRPFSPAMAPGALAGHGAGGQRSGGYGEEAVGASGALAGRGAGGQRSCCGCGGNGGHGEEAAPPHERMQALSERLGWRLPSLDEAVVEETCREIGVTKAVFKVWMYNNRHKFIGGHISRRSRRGASAATGAVAAAILPSPPAAVVRHPSHAATIGYFRVKPATASGGSPHGQQVSSGAVRRLQFVVGLVTADVWARTYTSVTECETTQRQRNRRLRKKSQPRLPPKRKGDGAPERAG